MHHHLKRVQLSESPKHYIPEIITGQLISITGGLMAGALLSTFRHSFEPVVGFFILLPGVIDGTGNIQGSLAARLHHTVLRWPSLHNNRFAWRNNYQAVFVLSIILGLVLGGMAVMISYILYRSINWRLILIAFISCVIVNNVLAPVIGWLTDWLNDHGHDPDNVMGAILTSLADILGIAMLGLTVYILF